jgi:hypothetical protein
MSDLIKREDVLNVLRAFGWTPIDGLYLVVKQDIPSANRPQEWIPCSERLPSEDEQDPELGVIVTLGNGYSGLQYDWYHDGHWYDWNGFVVAWMPLPKPYKKKDDA